MPYRNVIRSESTPQLFRLNSLMRTLNGQSFGESFSGMLSARNKLQERQTAARDLFPSILHYRLKPPAKPTTFPESQPWFAFILPKWGPALVSRYACLQSLTMDHR